MGIHYIFEYKTSNPKIIVFENFPYPKYSYWIKRTIVVGV